jgi:N-acetyl-anhydromuramyl-L-alanine amidase AmpD
VSLNFSRVFAVILVGFALFTTSCASSLKEGVESREKIVLLKPLTLLMPTTNYNQRPDNTKIDTIIIHHTAPFPSLTRVGYFFQDINSRVSSHYIVGKEGLIIECVAEKERAWHAGPSVWLGKNNVNDYSVGIEVLNDGDNKDPFTGPQYDSLARLTAYLMNKYDVPVSRVIGHRDIAYPLGRKVDPADNFDWKMFKAKLRANLKQSQNFFGWGDLPQESNFSVNQIKNFLNSESPAEREFGLGSLLTVNYKPLSGFLERNFDTETVPAVKAKYLKIFDIYQDKTYLDRARQIFAGYNNEAPVLTAAAASYLYSVDKDNSRGIFLKAFSDPGLDAGLRSSLTGIISNYSKDAEAKNLLTERLSSTADKQEKKTIIENIAKFEDKGFNSILLPYLGDNVPDDLKATAIDTLRVTFDENVENKLISMLKNNVLAKDVLESITWTLLRRDSAKGIATLQEDDVYNQLSPKEEIGVFNTVARLKISGSEDWLIQKADKAGDDYAKASAYLALGRLQGDKSFTYLMHSLKDNLPLNFIIFKALANFDKPEMSRALSQVMQKDNIPVEVKLLAVSTIKENKMTNLLPALKAMYVENKDPDLDMVIEDTIKTLEK